MHRLVLTRLLTILGSLPIITGCAPKPEKHIDRCLEGTIATAGGCVPLPGWDPWSWDAGAKPQPGPDGGGPQDAGASVDSSADSGTPDGGAAPFDPSGVWATRIVNAQTVSSNFAEPETVVFTTLSIVEINPLLQVTTRHCTIEVTPYAGVSTIYPEAALAAVDVRVETASISGPARVGAPFTMSRTHLLGWRTVLDPTAAPLPQTAGDFRVEDADGDQHPGVTLLISGELQGAIYVAARATVEMNGRILTPDRIQGGSRTRQDQSVIGASDEILAYGETSAEPIPEESSFSMVRAGEATDCAALLAAADELFPAP